MSKIRPRPLLPLAALKFGAATSDRADGACDSLDNLTKLSALVLLRPTTLTTARWIISKYVVDAGWGILLSGTAGLVQFYWGGVTTNTSYITNTNAIFLNQWTWLALSVDQGGTAGALAKFYHAPLANGAFVVDTFGSTTDGSGGYDSDAATNFAIGNAMKTPAPVNAFQGQIGFAAVWNRVIGKNEFTGLVKRTVPLAQTHPLVLYRPGLNHNDGTVVHDESGNGNHLTITGAVQSGTWPRL